MDGEYAAEDGVSIPSKSMVFRGEKLMEIGGACAVKKPGDGGLDWNSTEGQDASGLEMAGGQSSSAIRQMVSAV